MFLAALHPARVPIQQQWGTPQEGMPLLTVSVADKASWLLGKSLLSRHLSSHIRVLHELAVLLAAVLSLWHAVLRWGVLLAVLHTLTCMISGHVIVQCSWCSIR